MKQNKALKRSYIFTYIMWLFGNLTTALLFYRFHIALFIVLLIIVIATLALLIVGHTFYEKDYKKFFFIGGSGIFLFNVINIIGFIVELIFTSSGKGATYPWVVFSITLVAQVLVDIFFYLDVKKYIAKKNVPELI